MENNELTVEEQALDNLMRIRNERDERKTFSDIKPTILVDLSISEEEIWEKIDRSRRKNINKAKKNNLLFREGNLNEFRYFYYNIYEKVWEEGGTKTEPYEVVLNKIKKDHTFFVIEKNKKIIGGAIVGEETVGRLNFSIVGANPKYNKFRTNDFLYWNLLLFGKKQKKDYADFNGYQLKARGHLEGVNRFKKMWGGFIHNDYVYSNSLIFILKRKIYRNLPSLRNFFDILRGRKTKKFNPKNN